MTVDFDPDALFPDGAELPPHSANCMVCGPANAAGLNLRVRRHGDTVVADHVFDARHVGAPGVAHGGAIAAVCDDLFGFLLYLAGRPAVTRSLTVDYHAPVRLGVNHHLVARIDHREGRRLSVSLTGHDDKDQRCFTAHAVFVAVSLDRLLQHADETSGRFTALATAFPNAESRSSGDAGSSRRRK